MSEKNTGGPAFPTDNEHQSGPSTFHYEGMTLRDYFAAKAVQTAYEREVAEAIHYGEDGWYAVNEGQIAARAYRLADAMLKARES